MSATATDGTAPSATDPRALSCLTHLLHSRRLNPSASPPGGVMIATRQQAVARALDSTTNVPRYCARWTRERYGAPALGDYDGDGAADAEDMWKAARIRNEGDTNPPAGVPVYWGGGSQDNGHIAVSLGGGLVRSTDAGGPGKVATVPLDFPTREWGMPYLGWSEDLYGYDIPDPEGDLRRKHQAQLEKAKARGAKWKRWLDRNRNFRARLRKKLQP